LACQQQFADPANWAVVRLAASGGTFCFPILITYILYHRTIGMSTTTFRDLRRVLPKSFPEKCPKRNRRWRCSAAREILEQAGGTWALQSWASVFLFLSPHYIYIISYDIGDVKRNRESHNM